MSRITDAKAAIDHAAQQLATVATNPLADAIVEAGVGLSFGPKDVQLTLAMIDAIDKHGPGTNQVLTYGSAEPAQQQTSAQHTAGAQPPTAAFTANTPAQPLA